MCGLCGILVEFENGGSHLNREKPCFQAIFDKNKNPNFDTLGIRIRVHIWQREKDSNPHIRSQSPLCYLYTIPLNARAIIPMRGRLVKDFL